MLPLLSIYFPILYVLPFYLWRTQLPRDHPITIRRRAILSACSCVLLAWIPTYITLQRSAPRGSDFSLPPKDGCHTSDTIPLLLHAMGFHFHPRGLLLPPLLIAILYTGPMFQDIIQHKSLIKRHFIHSYIGLRNLVIAPLTEELCFRSGLISFLLVSGVSPPRALWASPLPFALAHIHHAVDLIVYQSFPVGAAVAQCTLQVAYTSLFGWFAAFVLIRTGQYPALVLTHSLCNYMGIPHLSAAVPPSVASQTDTYKIHITQAAFILGVVGFIALLYPFTNPRLYGSPTYLELFTCLHTHSSSPSPSLLL